jgi:hypothetical protein
MAQAEAGQKAEQVKTAARVRLVRMMSRSHVENWMINFLPNLFKKTSDLNNRKVSNSVVWIVFRNGCRQLREG